MSKLGQNFLTSKKIIKDIVSVSNEKSLILEIGPGKGIMTEALLEKTKVIAIEKDVLLYEKLKERFEKEIKEKRLILLNADVRDTKWEKHIRNKKYSIVANIPYYITGVIIKKFLESKHQPKNMILVIQKEVAERIARDKKESILSLSVKLFANVKYVKTISKKYFSPKPKVDSAILLISDIKAIEKKVKDRYFKMIKTAFQQKRKTMLKKFNKQKKLQKIMINLNINEKTRAEDVEFATWKKVVHNSFRA